MTPNSVLKSRLKRAASNLILRPILFFLFLPLLSLALYGCQSFATGRPGRAITKFPLVYQEQISAILSLNFDKNWQIYPEGSAVKNNPYEAKMALLRENRLSNNVKLLFFGVKKGVDKTEQFFAQTRFIVDKRPEVNLEAYANFLMRTAYSHVESAQKMDMIKTAGNIEGQLLRYSYSGTVYFELIYRVQDFFLRTIISTPTSFYQSEDDFNIGKDYILAILQSIAAEAVPELKGGKTRDKSRNKVSSKPPKEKRKAAKESKTQSESKSSPQSKIQQIIPFAAQ